MVLLRHSERNRDSDRERQYCELSAGAENAASPCMIDVDQYSFHHLSRWQLRAYQVGRAIVKRRPNIASRCQRTRPRIERIVALAIAAEPRKVMKAILVYINHAWA